VHRGSCPNIACLPSKNGIWSARVAHLVHHAAHFGTMTGAVKTDMAKVRQRKRDMVNREIDFHLKSGQAWIANTGAIDPLAKRAPRLTKPLIVVTHGDTWNMAHELHLVADIRVAAANTRFGQDAQFGALFRTEDFKEGRKADSCIDPDRFACFMAKKAETRGPFVLVRCSVDRQVGSDSMVI
jgi:hypothetical protein